MDGRGVSTSTIGMAVLFMAFGVSGVSLATPAGARTAGQVVELLRRVQEVGIPPTIPADFARRADPLAIEDYPTWVPFHGFLQPELFRDRDPKLYRDLTRLWGKSDRARLELIPGLTEAYLHETDPTLKADIHSAIDAFLDDAFDVEGRDQIAASAVERVLRSNARSEDRRRFVRLLLDQNWAVAPLVSDALLEAARGRDRADDELRWLEIQALVRAGKRMTTSVTEYLLQVARGDPHPGCRVEATVGLVGPLSEETWVPLALSTLGATLDADPVSATALVLELAVRRRREEAAPLLVRALGSSSLELRGSAVLGMERIFELTGTDLGYDSVANAAIVRSESMAAWNDRIAEAQQGACSAWRRWWEARHSTDGPRVQPPRR